MKISSSLTHQSDIANENQQSSFSLSNPILKRVFRGVGNALLTLIVIGYLTFFGLTMAERGREKLPAQPLNAAGQAVGHIFDYLFDHPETYYLHKAQIPWFEVVRTTLANSAGLLITAMLFAAVIGISLGLLAARIKGKAGGALVVTISVLGMSTPSFFLGMLFWIFNIYVIYRGLGMKALPQAGFGWDWHILMPSLVLAARPLAQIAQVTYVSLTDVMGQDYIRTARSKGLSPRLINNRHALRNVLIPVLTTMGTSMRFSLASLPVVETFFVWPGVGLTLLQAIDSGMSTLVVDLIISLGLFFLAFNLFLDILYPLIDPRLRKNGGAAESVESVGFKEFFQGFRDIVTGFFAGILELFRPASKKTLPPLLSKLEEQHNGEGTLSNRPTLPWALRLVFGNPAFLLGSTLVIACIIVAVFGESMIHTNPYQVHGVEMVNGVIGSPPFKPSSVFPWGTDHIGRDVQAFVVSGARRTLTLAFFAMLARVALGTILGLLAGWWQGSWFDNLINRLMNIWAAFPITIFAMLLIQALGIQQGTWVFILALCVVGWGEVTQFVRAQTIRIKPQLYIEAARALGARPAHLLGKQVFPNLVPSLLTISALEMAGVLMLLAELGFLNIFMGGGFTVELFVGKYVHFSDVPEWGAMLANILQWWRSYPWMAWYPGAAFFLAIIAFNLFGEGIRHFIEESRINLSRMFNRYTFAGSLVVVLVASFTMQQTGPLNTYRSVTKDFNIENVMVDIGTLSGAEFEGRESGTDSAKRTAEYIAQRMQDVGLFFSNVNRNYFEIAKKPRQHFYDLPILTATDGSENTVDFKYRQDFAEWVWRDNTSGNVSGELASISLGPVQNQDADLRAINNFDLLDNIVMIREEDLTRFPLNRAVGFLVVTKNPDFFEKKYLFNQDYRGSSTPMLAIKPATADRLLKLSGSSIEAFDQEQANTKSGEAVVQKLGIKVHFVVDAPESRTDSFYTVVGILPGTGAATQSTTPGVFLDQEAVVVAAHYDGLGVGPDGVLYPGANDNASGVAAMLEMARVLKNSGFAPKRTIIFVAWSGAERYEQLNINDVVNASSVLDEFKIQGIVELTGIGAGSGKSIALGEGSSYRLVKLFQSAASAMNVSTTTRGRDPHYGMPKLPLIPGRTVPSIYVTWDGSDNLAHTPFDVFEMIDMKKIEKVAKSTLLLLSVMSREINY